MKLIRNITVLALALAATAACNKQGTEAYVPEQEEIAFVLDGEFAPAIDTRVTETTTSNLSTLYVTASTGSETYKFSNQSFTKSGSSWTGGKYWAEPASGQTTVAYHFYLSNSQLTVPTSGTAGPTIAPANANTDVVVDYLASPAYKEVATAHLEHIFARFTDVTLKCPAGYKVSNLKLSFNPITTGTFTLKQMDANTVDATHPAVGWTSFGSAASSPTYLVGTASSGISIATGASYTKSDNDVWFVPGSYVLTLSYNMATDNNDWNKDYTKTATVALQRGKKNKIVLNNNEPNIPPPGDDVAQITFNIDVTDWTDNPLNPVF